MREDIQPFAKLSQNATTLVYKAYQPSLERFVLLKRLRPEFSADEDLSARFQDEARLIARVPHPNIVSVYAYGSDEGGAYFVAEYVDGKDLEALVEQGRVPSPIALFILSECARGLKAAHDKGVLHRDLKPSNILVSNEGEVKLSDFGLASVAGAPSESGEIRGTLPYMPPEHVRGQNADPRSDLFSLGVVLYELLTGRRAFAGTGPSEILDNVLHYDPRPLLAATPGVGSDVQALCTRLMAKDPAARYQNADELLDNVASVQTRSARRAGQDDLKAYLDDTAAYDAAASSAVIAEAGAVESKAEADATAFRDDPRLVRAGEKRSDRFGTSASRWRRAGLLAAALTVAGGIIYAGMTMLGGVHNASDAGRSPQETTRSGLADSKGAAVLRDTTVDIIQDRTTGGGEDEADVLQTNDTTELDGIENALAAHAERQDDPDTRGSEGDDSREEDAAARRENESTTSAESIPMSEDVQSEEQRDGDAAPGADGQDGPSALHMTEHDEMANASGRIEIRVDPAAAVFVDGDSVGTASGERAMSIEVGAGDHTVTLKNPHFPTYTQRVTVPKEGEHGMEISLFDLVGRLDLRVRPWAVVYVNGDSMGVTPFNPPMILTPGVHRIRMVHERLNVDHTVSVTIEKGGTLRREFDLTRLP